LKFKKKTGQKLVDFLENKIGQNKVILIILKKIGQSG
jgi:hypothetical protein